MKRTPQRTGKEQQLLPQRPPRRPDHHGRLGAMWMPSSNW